MKPMLNPNPTIDSLQFLRGDHASAISSSPKTALGLQTTDRILHLLLHQSQHPFMYKKMRNRMVTSDRSVELQPVPPSALSSHTLFYGSFELPPVPPKVEAVLYRGDKTREIDYEDCVICLGSFEEGDECWLLKDCNHAYHKNCIEKWLRRCWNCPLCRGAIILV